MDEPLANLDYKLREELRDELPKLFAGRNAIVVYATIRALRGAAVRRQHGHPSMRARVTQFGPTSATYRTAAANTLTTAQRLFGSADQHRPDRRRKRGSKLTVFGAGAVLALSGRAAENLT